MGCVGIHNLGHGKRGCHLLHDEHRESVEEFKRVKVYPPRWEMHTVEDRRYAGCLIWRD
jgi:hypothetical protein